MGGLVLSYVKVSYIIKMNNLTNPKKKNKKESKKNKTQNPKSPETDPCVYVTGVTFHIKQEKGENDQYNLLFSINHMEKSESLPQTLQKSFHVYSSPKYEVKTQKVLGENIK